jgi:hypothetical protein
MPVLKMTLLLLTVLVQLAASKQTAGWLFAIGPDVAKLLAVGALRKGILGLISLYLDGNVAEAGEFAGYGCSFRRQTSG